MKKLFNVLGNSDIVFSHSKSLYPAPENIALHIHDCYELYCFVSGEADYIVEGTVYSLVPGTVLLMRPGEVHGARIRSNMPYIRYVFSFGEELIRKLDGELSLLEPYCQRPLGKQNLYTPDDLGKLSPIELLAPLLEYRQGSDEQKLAASCYLFLLLERISEAFHAKKGEQTQSLPASQIIAYINADLGGNMSVEALCKKFYMSYSQMERLFKSRTNMSVAEYVNTKRMYRAKELLAHGMPAGKVCLECGFREYSAFFRAYKKMFGVSPKGSSLPKRPQTDEGNEA